MSSLYINIFFESAWVACVLSCVWDAVALLLTPFGIVLSTPSSTTFSAMRAFGGYSMGQATIFAIAGSMLGQLVSWLSGFGLLILLKKLRNVTSNHRYRLASETMHRYFFWVTIISPLEPLGSVVTAIAGYLGLPLKKAMAFAFLGYIVRFSLLLFS